MHMLERQQVSNISLLCCYAMFSQVPYIFINELVVLGKEPAKGNIGLFIPIPGFPLMLTHIFLELSLLTYHLLP